MQRVAKPTWLRCAHDEKNDRNLFEQSQHKTHMFNAQQSGLIKGGTYAVTHLQYILGLVRIGVRTGFRVGVLNRHMECGCAVQNPNRYQVHVPMQTWVKESPETGISNTDPHGSISCHTTTSPLLTFKEVDEVLAEAYYAPGMRMAVTLKIKRLVFSCAVVWIKPCSAKRVPPAKKHIPRTRSKLERMEPTTVQARMRV